jgi:L-lactate dehydrogenase complex protein LldG
MDNARDVVLNRIRAVACPGAEADPRVAYEAIPRPYLRAGHLDAEARLHRFVDRLRDYDARVQEVAECSVPEAILASLAQGGGAQVVVAEGFPAGFLPSELAFTSESQASLADLDACGGVLTTCTVAIASSGTIALTHGPGEGARRLTLVPDRHLCVVRAAQVVETLPEAMDRLAPLASRLLTFISGPSATADIEMTRIRGVHGPRHLEVLLIR